MTIFFFIKSVDRIMRITIISEHKSRQILLVCGRIVPFRFMSLDIRRTLNIPTATSFARVCAAYASLKCTFNVLLHFFYTLSHCFHVLAWRWGRACFSIKRQLSVCTCQTSLFTYAHRQAPSALVAERKLVMLARASTAELREAIMMYK